jgi:hypothetical protein
VCEWWARHISGGREGGREGFAYLSLVSTATALEGVLAKVGNGNHATEVAHVHSIGIGLVVESLFEELSRTVRDHAITLHFSESKTSIA